MTTLLCYGDSNTYGRDAITQGRLDWSVRWTGVLQGALGPEFRVIEEGLNGRTTVWDDPVRGGPKRNGGLYLVPCLESHSPLDLAVLMLGTNDCKARFSVTPYDIGQSILSLLDIVKAGGYGPRGAAPRVLLVAPPPLGRLTEYAETFQGGVPKSRELGRIYREIAEKKGCGFLDASTIISSSTVDGLHFDPDGHEKLAKTLAEIVRRMTA